MPDVQPRQDIGVGYAARRDEALRKARGSLDAAYQHMNIGLFHAAAAEAQEAQGALMRAWNEQRTGEIAKGVRGA